MDLQTLQLIFYSLGIIFFTLLCILILFILITLFIVKKKINNLSGQLGNKVEHAKDLYDHKEKYILRFMGKGSSSIIETISEIFVKNKKK